MGGDCSGGGKEMSKDINKNQQPKTAPNESPVFGDSTNYGRRKLKPSFDMGVTDKRAESAYKLGGTPIE